MDELVRFKVNHLLLSVAVLLIVSVANLGLGLIQSGKIEGVQRTIQERIIPLCLSPHVYEACRAEINRAEVERVARLCHFVHERLNLPTQACRKALTAIVTQVDHPSPTGVEQPQGAVVQDPASTDPASSPGHVGPGRGDSSPPPATSRPAPPPAATTGIPGPPVSTPGKGPLVRLCVTDLCVEALKPGSGPASQVADVVAALTR